MAAPQLYLVTPRVLDPRRFIDDLAAALDAAGAAAVELDLAAPGEADWRAAIDALRPVVQERNVAFLLAGRAELAAATGCDGVRIDSVADYAAARQAVGPQAIVGASAGASRHAAMLAGEAGADFVALDAEPDLVEWWAELFEIPCLAWEVTAETAPDMAAADFIALRDAVWTAPAGPAAALRELRAALDG